nr:hypothetical protein [Tanacetum cinerariifolium]
MERGFLDSGWKGRGVKEKQGTAGSSKDNNRVNVELGSNSATRIPNVVNACLESFRTVFKAHGIRYSASANEENTNDAGTVNDVANNGTTVGPALAGNTPDMSTLYANVTGCHSLLKRKHKMR